MNTTAKQSNGSVQSNDIRSLTDAELDAASGAIGALYMMEVSAVTLMDALKMVLNHSEAPPPRRHGDAY